MRQVYPRLLGNVFGYSKEGTQNSVGEASYYITESSFHAYRDVMKIQFD
jgi:hypothetical protein